MEKIALLATCDVSLAVRWGRGEGHPATGKFPSQMARNAELSLVTAEQAVEQHYVIWDTMAPMWCHFNDINVTRYVFVRYAACITVTLTNCEYLTRSPSNYLWKLHLKLPQSTLSAMKELFELWHSLIEVVYWFTDLMCRQMTLAKCQTVLLLSAIFTEMLGCGIWLA